MVENKIEEIKEILPHIDIIVISSLLHEVESPVQFLNSIKAICTDKTIVHINVPNANSLHRLLALEAGLIKEEHELSEQNVKLQQHTVFDMKMLCKMVRDAGFEIVDKGSYFIKPFTHQQMQCCLEENIIDDRILEGFKKLIKYMPEYGAEIYVDVKNTSIKVE